MASSFVPLPELVRAPACDNLRLLIERDGLPKRSGASRVRGDANRKVHITRKHGGVPNIFSGQNPFQTLQIILIDIEIKIVIMMNSVR
jgi:hypothetical protein